MPDTSACIPRVEMMAWKAMLTERRDVDIVFGDYGIRSANAADGIIAKHSNAKIRYTINNQFFVVRGHSKQTTLLGTQNRRLAEILVASPHFMGAAFSWGDEQIADAANPTSKPKGSPTTWIGIDSNHHIQAVVAEVYEHQHRVVPHIATAPALA